MKNTTILSIPRDGRRLACRVLSVLFVLSVPFVLFSSPPSTMLNRTGLSISSPHFGAMLMGYPYLDGTRPTTTTLTNSTAILIYTNGVELTCTLATNILVFATGSIGVPPVQTYTLELHISPGLGARGVKWQISDTTNTLSTGAIPRDTLDPSAGTTLYTGTADTLTLLDPTGPTLTITFPFPSTLTLTDNQTFSRVILTYLSPTLPTPITVR